MIKEVNEKLQKILEFNFEAMKEDLHWTELIDDGCSKDELKDAINELLDLLIELKRG